MESRILSTLANWGDTDGWSLWADEEGIAEQLKWDPSPTGQKYNQFKRQIERLEKLGYIQRTNEDRRIAKAIWSLTQAGRHRVEQPLTDEGVDVTNYIGKRIKSGTQIPRDIYRQLMTMHRNGELDLAFMSPKSKTGGS